MDFRSGAILLLALVGLACRSPLELPGDGGPTALDGGSRPPACSPTDPRAPAAVVSVFPEAGEAPYVEVLTRAQRTVRVMVYLMGTGGILDTLKAKAAAGVTVRVILDQGQTSNQRYFDQLQAAGAQVRWSDPGFPYMHAKVLVVDEAEAVVSTGNYSSYNIGRERNFAARLADPEDVADLVALFDADWDRGAVDLGCTRLLVSPVNARQRLLSFIASARSTLAIESMQFADSDVREAVAARKAAGVEVRVLLADPSWVDRNRDGAAYLAARAIPARWMASPGVHVKAILVDGTAAYLGSENLTYTSLSENREVGLIVTDAPAMQAMSATFERDWAAATAF
jgi:phosphatidylserine/phosphatidylglycerophosphate/cardiolipin synthase-like enzyme